MGDIKASIQTGLFHRFVKPSAEWTALLDEARKNEEALAARYPTEDQQLRAACRIIAGEAPPLRSLLESAGDPEAFCASCLTLRGPFEEGPLRRQARELSRLLGYLSAGAPIPDSAQAVLDLWETANRLEPRWYDDQPAHFRTSADHVPFSRTGFSFEDGPVPRGMETAAPEEIPELVSLLLTWLRARELPPELTAFTAHHLFVKIHPFPDGNGHTARLLCCGLLSRVYAAPTLTVFLREIAQSRALIYESILNDGARDGDMCPACCDLIRLLIRGQERLLGGDL